MSDHELLALRPHTMGLILVLAGCVAAVPARLLADVQCAHQFPQATAVLDVCPADTSRVALAGLREFPAALDAAVPVHGGVPLELPRAYFLHGTDDHLSVSTATISRSPYMDQAWESAPRQQGLSLAVEHTFRVMGGGTITPRLDVRTGGVTPDGMLDRPLHGLAVANVVAIWRSADRHWSAQAAVVNVTGERLFMNLSDLSRQDSWSLWQAAPPRYWNIAVARYFE